MNILGLLQMEKDRQTYPLANGCIVYQGTIIMYRAAIVILIPTLKGQMADKERALVDIHN